MSMGILFCIVCIILANINFINYSNHWVLYIASIDKIKKKIDIFLLDSRDTSGIGSTSEKLTEYIYCIL